MYKLEGFLMQILENIKNLTFFPLEKYILNLG
jgi:hypothetical protein